MGTFLTDQLCLVTPLGLGPRTPALKCSALSLRKPTELRSQSLCGPDGSRTRVQYCVHIHLLSDRLGLLEFCFKAKLVPDALLLSFEAGQWL